VLVFVFTLGTFAIPQVLGAPAGFSTVTTIYADLSIGGDPSSFLEAVTLALLLVLVAAACVAPADALLGPRLRSARPADAQGVWAVAGRCAVRRGRPSSWPATCC
jgi:iron(III) transport system permease protein